MFRIIVLSVVTLMHFYVFLRALSVPFLKPIPPRLLIGAGIGLWVVFLLGIFYGRGGSGLAAKTLEFIGMNWMGVLFLCAVSLLAFDLVAGFGLLMPRWAPRLRGLGLAIGIALSAIALVQGLRAPVVRNHEVYISGLPSEMNGTVIVALSDLHLGSPSLGKRWLERRVAQVQGLKPDLTVLLGDILEGRGRSKGELLLVLRRLSAPMGVWAVLGNHEFYGGHDESVEMLNGASFHVLRDSWAEARPGFFIVGLDDLTANGRAGRNDSVSKALAGLPAGGATVLLSHTPWQTGRIAEAGVDLMLSGHTHGGQIWPFGYLVKRRYPLFEGRYEAGPMTVIVSRGTGTWGPRMRLWHPGEILRVTLRAEMKREEKREAF